MTSSIAVDLIGWRRSFGAKHRYGRPFRAAATDLLNVLKSTTYLCLTPFKRPPNANLAAMFRTAAFRALRLRSTSSAVRQFSSLRPRTTHTFLRPRQISPAIVIPNIRCYSAPSGLSKEEVQGRIMDLLKNFDKVGTSSLLINF